MEQTELPQLAPPSLSLPPPSNSFTNLQSPAVQRGVLFVFEGIDRSGKTTMASLLHSTLLELGHSAILLAFPMRFGGVGTALDAYLRGDTEERARWTLDGIHALFAVNRWQCQEVIRQALLTGTHVILDRYVHSGIAYSEARGLDPLRCRMSDVNLIAPDCIFWMLCHPVVASKRNNYGATDVEETVAFQTLVHDSYQKQYSSGVWHQIFSVTNNTMNAKQIAQSHIDTMQERILPLALERITQCNSTPNAHYSLITLSSLQ